MPRGGGRVNWEASRRRLVLALLLHAVSLACIGIAAVEALPFLAAGLLVVMFAGNSLLLLLIAPVMAFHMIANVTPGAIAFAVFLATHSAALLLTGDLRMPRELSPGLSALVVAAACGIIFSLLSSVMLTSALRPVPAEAPPPPTSPARLCRGVGGEAVMAGQPITIALGSGIIASFELHGDAWCRFAGGSSGLQNFAHLGSLAAGGTDAAREPPALRVVAEVLATPRYVGIEDTAELRRRLAADIGAAAPPGHAGTPPALEWLAFLATVEGAALQLGTADPDTRCVAVGLAGEIARRRLMEARFCLPPGGRGATAMIQVEGGQVAGEAPDGPAATEIRAAAQRIFASLRFLPAP